MRRLIAWASSIALLATTVAIVAAAPAQAAVAASQIVSTTGGDLFVMNEDGSDQRQLTDGAIMLESGARVGLYAQAPRLAPDGLRIAFTGRVPDLGTDVYVINVDGTSLRRVTTDAKDSALPAWSPNGSRLAYLDADGGIATINVDGSDTQVVVPSNPNFSIRNSITWSPDGSRLAYIGWSREPDPACPGGRVTPPVPYTVGVDSIIPPSRILTDRDGYWSFDSLDWSPAGFAFVRTMTTGPGGCYVTYPDGAQADVYLADAEGFLTKQLTSTDASEYHVAWSPDGSEVATKDGFDYAFYSAVDGTNRRIAGAGVFTNEAFDWGPLAGAPVADGADFTSSVSHTGLVKFDAMAPYSAGMPIAYGYHWSLPEDMGFGPGPQFHTAQSTWQWQFDLWAQAAKNGTVIPVGLTTTDVFNRPIATTVRRVDLCAPESDGKSNLDFAWDVRCYERELGDGRSAGDVLSLLRQEFYPGESKDAEAKWDLMIPCKVSPRPGYDNSKLKASLKASSTTMGGTDLQHVIAGLDAAQCPRSDVLPAPYNRVLEDVPNWHGATWLGDVATAVANHTADVVDGKTTSLMDFFGPEDENSAASDLDLQGDIDALVLHFAADQSKCSPTFEPAKRFSQPGARLSDLIRDYYSRTGSVGQYRLDRHNCIAKILDVDGGFDVRQMQRLYASKVEDMAFALYANSRGGAAASRPAIMWQLKADSKAATRIFADWLYRNAR